MGDCRIRIVIASALLPDNGSVNTTDTSVSFVRFYSADTTIREVVEDNAVLKRLYFGSSSETVNESEGKEFSLWDCTFHPPKDITSWPKQDYPNLQGVKSKTIHAAGMFPSGTLIAIPKGMAPNQFSNFNNAFVDVQYNNANTYDGTGGNNGRLEFKNPELNNTNKPLPSQVMESVTNRFLLEDREDDHTNLEGRTTTARYRVQREREKLSKLDMRIAILEERSENNHAGSSKKKREKKVSDQVLKMLVKSRAVGDKNLKQQDRIYFQCFVLLEDDNDSTNDNDDISASSYPKHNPENIANGSMAKEYRYFSPQDTFARIANSFSSHHKKTGDFFSEVLCRRPIEQFHNKSGVNDNEITEETKLTHRRFPFSMRIYEAILQGYLSENNTKIDTLIIRWYKDRNDATPPIQDEETNCTGSGNVVPYYNQMVTDEPVTPIQVDEDIIASDGTAQADCITFKDEILSDIIQKMDDLANKGKKHTNKSSSTALKVRQMKLKSKSKGDKKLKIEDRIFLEVVTILKNESAISEGYYLSKRDHIERIVQYTSTGNLTKNAKDWQFLIPLEDSCYRLISTTSILMQELEEKGILKSFDRLILRPKSHQSQH